MSLDLKILSQRLREDVAELKRALAEAAARNAAERAAFRKSIDDAMKRGDR